jgi:hypothetical protein
MIDYDHTRSAWRPHSYENLSFMQERYESVVLSRHRGAQIRSIPTLHHKAKFPYESILAHAITCRDMHVHAVLSSKEESILSMTEERMSRWPHHPDI